jgi:RHS repeat-associated protein
VTAVTSANGLTAADPLGQVATQGYPSGLVVAFAPNALGQATQAGSYATGAQYFPNGAIKQFTYGNGIVHTMVQNTRQLPASSTDTGAALSQQFVYDENGNVASVTDALDAARSKTMAYDGLDRLTSASATIFGGTGTHQFAYDPLDNLRSWTLGGVKDQSNYVYGADNRLSQIKDAGGGIVHAFSYDPQGNVTTRNGVAHDFDYGNRLRSVGTTESYLYDGHGRRVQTTQSSGSYTRWLYASSGQMLFSAKGPSNETTHENVYLAGSLVAIIDRDGPSNAVTATKYQHTDALGSPVAMSNEAGAIIERTNYDPYGGPIGKTVNGLGYTGHVMDGATGLTYMQQRYYDPTVGRFLSVDPVMTDLKTGKGFGRFTYAANNPYRFTDPDGRKEYDCRKGGSCAAEIKVANLKPGDVVRTPGATVVVRKNGDVQVESTSFS